MSLIKMSLSAACMIAAVIIARAISIERLPKKTFLALWSIILIRLLVPFSIQSPASIYSVMPQEIPPREEVHIQEDGGIETVSYEYTAEESAEYLPPSFEPAELVPQTAPSLSLSDCLPVIWAVGAIATGVYFSAEYIRSYLVFRTALPVDNKLFSGWRACCPLKRKLEIKQIDRISTPLTYGVLRPVILLPKASLSQSDRTLFYVLTHEYIHIRRFDSAVKMLLMLALCIHWMNPFVWVMYLLMNRDIELACDESVLQLLGRENRSAYAYALIDMEESRSHLSPLYSGFNKTAIEKRIGAIMKMKKTSLISMIVAVALVIGVTTVFATSPKKEDDTDYIKENGVYTELELETYKPYEKFGMTYNKDKKLFYYEGKPVRFFYDAGTGLSFTNAADGEVDIEADRNEKNELTGLHHSTKEAYDRRTETFSNMSETVTDTAIEASKDTGKNVGTATSAAVEISKDAKKNVETTVAEAVETSPYHSFIDHSIYDQYKRFGLTLDENDNLYFHGDPIRYFSDTVPPVGYYNKDGIVDVSAIRRNDKLLRLEKVESSKDTLSNNSVKYKDYVPYYVPYDECLKKANGDEGKALVEYFKPFEKYDIVFKPSSEGSNKGNLYDLYEGEKIISTFKDYSQNKTFTFKSENADDKYNASYSGHGFTFSSESYSLASNSKRYKAYAPYDECLKKANGDEGKALAEYFKPFERYDLVFKPSSEGSSEGDLYRGDKLISVFYDYTQAEDFIFKSKSADGKIYITYDGSLYDSSGPHIPYAATMFYFTDYGIHFDKEKDAWVYKDEIIRKFKNGQFTLDLHVGGTIDVEAVFEDGCVKEIVSEAVK